MRLAAPAAAALATVVVASAGPLREPPQPDPEAMLDGCTRSALATIATQTVPNWVYVDDRSAPPTGPPPPPQWAEGVADSRFERRLAVHPSGSDQPATHFAYDAVVNVRPDAAYAFLLAGDAGVGTGNYHGRNDEDGRLHSEWEEDALPLWAWPRRGDRVRLLGNWVWDCDHFQPGGEHTELHPLRAVWVVRRASPRSRRGESEGDLFVSTRETPAGMQADCAHRTKGDRDAFKACLAAEPDWQDVTGSYRFLLPVPPRPSRAARLVVAVADRRSAGARPKLRLKRRPTGVEISFDLTSPRGRRVVVAKQIVAGWRPARAQARHYELAFERLRIVRSLDEGADAPAEWNVYWNAAGLWGRWKPAVLRPRDGQSFPGRQSVDLFLSPRQPWALLVFARECDLGTLNARGPEPLRPCPRTAEFDFTGNDSPGELVREFSTAGGSVGRHVVRSHPQAGCPRGCYSLTFSVRRVRH